jgi:hypothetical protein
VLWVTVTGITHVVSGYDASLFGSLLEVPMVSCSEQAMSVSILTAVVFQIIPSIRNRHKHPRCYRGTVVPARFGHPVLRSMGKSQTMPWRCTISQPVTTNHAQLTDKVGRKVPMIAGTIGMIVSTIVQVTCPDGNIAQFMIGRFMMGASAALSALPGLALCAELCQ